MQNEMTAVASAPAIETSDNRESVRVGDAFRRNVGRCLVFGALAATAFNVLFPRADDPSDTVAVLMMMAENEVLRQVSFLGVTAALWILTAGFAGIYWMTNRGPAEVRVRLGFYGLIIGAAIFTVATGIGIVATHAAMDWVSAGSSTASAEYAIAAALNAADDGVWFLSIIAYWGSLGLFGAGILHDDAFPKWSGWTLLLLGFGNAIFAGVPLAYGGASQQFVIIFAVIAQLTLVWTLAMGIWFIRRSRTHDS